MPQKRYPEHQVERVRKLYASGLSQGAVADEIGVSQAYVFHLMKTHGIEARSRVSGKRTKTDAQNKRALAERA